MPHIAIKSFPRDFTDQDKQDLADEITEVMTRRFKCKQESVTMTLSYVAPEQWQSTVYQPDILGQRQHLIKKPADLT